MLYFMNIYKDVKSSINHSEEREINDLFVGRKVVEVDESRALIILDNGTEVHVVPNDGCGGCPSGYYEIKHLNMIKESDHVITAVSVKEENNSTEEERYNESDVTVYQLAVYASGVSSDDGVSTNLVEISGSDGNGYYGTGFVLEVTRE